MLKKLLCVTSVLMVLGCVDISLVADEIKELVLSATVSDGTGRRRSLVGTMTGAWQPQAGTRIMSMSYTGIFVTS
jgi:hypothetical protein